jgi:hypothetical protein
MSLERSVKSSCAEDVPVLNAAFVGATAVSTAGAVGLSLHAASRRAAAAIVRGCFMTQSE